MINEKQIEQREMWSDSIGGRPWSATPTNQDTTILELLHNSTANLLIWTTGDQQNVVDLELTEGRGREFAG